MSLSANDGAGAFRGPSGKTPPPAPSAAYAKRARELQGGTMSSSAAAAQAAQADGQRYRPPAIRALESGEIPHGAAPPIVHTPDGPLPPSTYGPGFRRARAGTLPSNVHLAAAQRFGDASDSLADTLRAQPAPGPVQPPVGRPHAASIAGLAPARPMLRHAASAVGAGALERNSRLRSGSLTLPQAPGARGDGGAFGAPLFALNNAPWGAGGDAYGGLGPVDELRTGALQHELGDEYERVNTLDYLGLDDGPGPRTATLSELRAQTQAALTGNIAAQGRMRASTVSNPYPRLQARATGGLLLTPGADEDEELYGGYGQQYAQPSRDQGYLTPGGGGYGGGLAPPAPARPRAISVGILDDAAARSLQSRAGAGEMLASPYVSEYQYAPALKEPKLGGRPSVHFPAPEPEPAPARVNPYLAAPNQQGRAHSPTKNEGSQQMQTPTRSLWIGNLDSSVTSEQLIHVFAPYGAIESLRLLPEKECGFVNFVDMSDAIRAKDDVLNRLGGNIGMPNGQTVRIGFGKAESAPVAPAKGMSVTSPGAGSPVGGLGKGAGGLENQLQSTPTRALWIGSIPSTTTPAQILSVFSPYGPIESARVLTHKNCGFINFERLDDAVRARKALNGRDILGSDVGAIRIGFAKVPVKNGADVGEDGAPAAAQGVGDLSVGATIHALRAVKGASTLPAEQQVLGGGVENYRSNLLLHMIGTGQHNAAFVADANKGQQARVASVTEQQMILKQLSGGSPDAEADIAAMADFRPPTMYYTTIPLVSERPNGRRWDAAKLRELRKRMDSNTMTVEEVDQVAADFLDGEIVDLASDWLGNTVVQKLFEKCSPGPRFKMLEKLSPHVAMIGIHKNGTWAAQKIIECVQTPEEVAIVAQNLRPYGPPLLLDQFGNYVVQCCLRFGPPANDFIFDAMVDRLWEIAQGRFGARSMRACLESSQITVNQQRRVATAIVLNSIPLATNPNGALLLTWLLDTSGFPSRYILLAPRFSPHLSHLCTHKLASLTVLRIVNQKVEPAASLQVVEALFTSPGDHVLTDVLGDQVNGVAVVHKILTSPFLDPDQRPNYIEATKRVIIELKVVATQAYRRLVEEVGLPIPAYNAPYPTNGAGTPTNKGPKMQQGGHIPGLPSGYSSSGDGLASMMAQLQMGGQNPQAGPPQLQLHLQAQAQAQGHGPPTPHRTRGPPHPSAAFSPSTDPFNPFGLRSPEISSPRPPPLMHRTSSGGTMAPPPGLMASAPSFGGQNPLGMDPQAYAAGMASPQQAPMSPHLYQAYMYQMYQQNQSMGAYQQS